MHTILINIAIAGTVVLCLALSGILLPFAHTLMIQYYNALIQSNNRLTDLSISGNPRAKYIESTTMSNLLKQGNFKNKQTMS